MRAREFVINVPITIKINGDGDPEVSSSDDARDPSKPGPERVMVPPLQQSLELQKAGVGKESPVIDDLTQDEKDWEDEDTTR